MGSWNFGWDLKSNLAPLLESCVTCIHTYGTQENAPVDLTAIAAGKKRGGQDLSSIKVN